MKFVCSFAWSDLEIQDEERTFIADLVDRMGLDEEERAMVKGWLELPPKAEEVDPQLIPKEHRTLFLAAAKAVVGSDNVLAPDEAENLQLFQALLGDEED